MTVLEKVSYLQGLFDGMGLDASQSNECRLISEILDVLKDVGAELEKLDGSVDLFGKELDAVSEDLSDVEDVVYGDNGDAACSCGHEGGLCKAVCPSCGEELQIDRGDLAAGFIDCPNCGQKFALSLEDGEDDDEDDED